MPPDASRTSTTCCEVDLERISCDGCGASGDLERWLEDGPRAETQELIDVLLAQGVQGARLLDIGAGVGAVHVALLEAGAASAVDVDASRDYLAEAEAEAERRGLADRIEYRYGDVSALAPELPAVDIVTADSVICCYPYLEQFLSAAVRSHPRLVGLTYPRDRWWQRAGMHLQNAFWAVTRQPDRWSIHRHAKVDRLLADAGYALIHDGGSWYWRVAVYRAHASEAPAGPIGPERASPTTSPNA
jgi:SAM-dependent methyltransferase